MGGVQCQSCVVSGGCEGVTGGVAGEEAGLFTGMRPVEAEPSLWSMKHLGSQGALWLWEREEA